MKSGLGRILQRIWQTPWFGLGVLTLCLLLVRVRPAWYDGLLVPIAIAHTALYRGVLGGLLAAAVGASLQWLALLPPTGGAPPQPAIYSFAWATLAHLLLGLAIGMFRDRVRRLDRLNADLTKAQDRLAALYRVAISMSSTLEMRDLLQIILRDAVGALGYPDSQLLLVDPESDELVLEAAHGLPIPLGTRVPRGQGITGWVLDHGEPQAVGDVTRDPRYIPGLSGARSEASVPLRWQGEITGVLNVESQEPNKYNEGDLQLLTTVAEQAAAYIANARLHRETKRMAITDHSTGLYNYRHFQERIAALAHQYLATGGCFSLLMLDLDYFKTVNDTYGHQTGDAVLQQVANLLQAGVRGGDEAFRYGGEEFAVILPDADTATALRVANRLRERVAQATLLSLAGRPLALRLTISVGVACFPADAATQVDLLLRADQALYAAKQAGRNRVVTVAGEVAPGEDAPKEPPAGDATPGQ